MTERQLPAVSSQRYANGSTPEQQREHDRRYRQKRSQALGWLGFIATENGMTRDQLTTESNAQLVARLLDQYNKEAGCQ